MLQEKQWIFDLEDDSKKPDTYFLEMETDLIYHKPKTIRDFAKVLNLSYQIVNSWFERPFVQKNSKYGRRRKLFVNYLHPELEKLKAKMPNLE